jgi:hypothetical protein
MAKSPEEMRQAMLDSLREKTGKSLPEWLRVIRASKRTKHGEIVKLLKEEHGVTHGYANQIALQALQPADAPALGSEGLVDAQYAGPKAALRPIYDALVVLVRRFGSDVELSPKKAYVSLRRAKQFALIQPFDSAFDHDPRGRGPQPQRAGADGQAGSIRQLQRDGQPPRPGLVPCRGRC